MRFRVLKNSFLGGQVSRDAVGRTDLPQYPHSCEILQNMIPLLSGGSYRRPGTVFQYYLPGDLSVPGKTGVLEAVASSPPRLIPFIVSNSQAYALLFGTNLYGPNGGYSVSRPGGGYMAWFRATGNTSAAPDFGALVGVVPYRTKALAPAASGTDEALYTRQGGPGAVANSGVNGNLSPVTILDVPDSLQSFDDDVWSVQYCQANDVLFLTHPDYQSLAVALDANVGGVPYIDTMEGSLVTLTGLKSAQSRPYLNMNSTAVTLAVSWTGTSNKAGDAVVLTASAALFDPLHAPRTGLGVSATDGANFALACGTGDTVATGGGMLFVRITSVSSATSAAAVLLTDVPSSYSKDSAQTEWFESAWSNYRGWPRACAVYQQRLVMAGTIHQPSTLWFTSTNGYGATISLGGNSFCKFTALGDGPDQGVVAGAKGTLANGQQYATPQDWVYYPVDDSQGDGQSTGPLGTQPFRISLATTSLDAIQYLSPDQQLFIGTGTQEWICAPQNGSFDVANSDCTIQSHYGSDLVQAVRIGYELIFVLQKKDEVRAYQYNYFDQSFFGEPVQLFFDEYPVNEEGVASGEQNKYAGRKKFRTIDWDASRSTLWCVDTSGSLFGLTRDRKLQVTAWHTHQIGGYDSSKGVGNDISYHLSAANKYTDSAFFQCDGSVISAVSTPNPLSGVRDVWMVVKRTYPGTTANFWSLERMIGANTVRKSAYSVVAPGLAQEPCYVDCAQFLTDSSAAVFTYSVGSQLVGATLTGTYYSQAWGIFVLGTTGPVFDNSGAGDLTLDQNTLPPDYGNASEPHTIVVGYPYTAIIQPTRFDMPSQIGTAQGAVKRISKVYARVFKSMLFKVGSPPPGKLETVRLTIAPEMAQSPEIFTGDKEIFVPQQFNRDGYLYILQDQPLPFTLVSLSVEGQEYEQ